METFASEEFTDVSLNQWLRRVPSEMLKAHLNIDKELAVAKRRHIVESADILMTSK
jgi:hypothetical protein